GYVMGYLGIPQMFIPAIGPSIGGFLVEVADWRWVFFINIPFAIAGLIVAWLVLPDNGIRRKVPFDFPGFLLAATWLSTGLIAISRGSADGWGSFQIRMMLSIAAVGFVLWVTRQLTAQHPLLDLRLFRLPEFVVSVTVTSLITATLFGGIFLMPLFLQNLQGMSPMQTGLLLLPQAFASAVVQPFSGRLFDRFGPRPLIIAGLAFMGWTQYQLSFIDLNTSYLHLQLLFIVRGLAMGLIAMPSNTAAMNAAPMNKAPDASSLVNMARQVFSAVGTAGFGTLLTSRQTYHYAMVSRHITPFDPGVVGYLASYQAEALHNGATEIAARAAATMSVARHANAAAGVMAFDDAFLVAAVLCFLGIIPTLFMKKTAIRRPPGGAPAGPPAAGPQGGPAARPAS
ncbi:MAG: DHA2 family efflux MFS transporter permease subunit, partial [Chloroflexi bacterium]|nr:DHA2 family efflux MFS transporter permease subunit [Chloroflexota bacterium]